MDNIRLLRPEKSKFFRYFKSYFPVWRKRKIGFYGCFGHGDLGDDTNFIVGRDLLGKDVLPVSKRCYAFNPRMLSALLIGGGGTLSRGAPYIPRRILTKEKWHFPVMLFSAGINCDYNQEFTQEAIDNIKKLCNICSYVTVRDKMSQRFLRDQGFDNVSILPHLELGLKEKSREFNFNKQGFTVGIVLTPHSAFDSHTFERIVDCFCQFTDYLTDSGKNVLFIPFERGLSECRKESELIQEIMKRVQNKSKVQSLGDDLEPEEVLFAIRKYCDVMVCTRLHSAVFSTNAGVPFICLSYNLMHRGFLEMLDASDLELSIFDNFSFSALRDKFEYMLSNYNAIRDKLVEKRDYLTEIICQQASHIRGILSNEL